MEAAVVGLVGCVVGAPGGVDVGTWVLVSAVDVPVEVGVVCFPCCLWPTPHALRGRVRGAPSIALVPAIEGDVVAHSAHAAVLADCVADMCEASLAWLFAPALIVVRAWCLVVSFAFAASFASFLAGVSA